MVRYSSLQELRLLAAPLTKESLILLDGFPDLKRLSIRGIPVMDEVLAVVARLERLEHLDLRDTSVRNSGAAYLTSLTNLKTLQLDPEYITDVSILLLDGALPDCEISPAPGTRP